MKFIQVRVGLSAKICLHIASEKVRYSYLPNFSTVLCQQNQAANQTVLYTYVEECWQREEEEPSSIYILS